jgi:hypothetical protein
LLNEQIKVGERESERGAQAQQHECTITTAEENYRLARLAGVFIR